MALPRRICDRCGRADGGRLKVVRIPQPLFRYSFLRRWCQRCRLAVNRQRSR